jgi:hypothetical protein
MESGFYFGLAVAVILCLLPFVTPMPKPVAWAGIAAAVVVMLGELLPIERRPSIWVVLFFTGGVMAIAAAVYLYVAPPQEVRSAALAGLTNAQLRERTITFAQTIRSFETEFKRGMPYPTARNREGYLTEFMEWSGKEAEIWRNQYRVEAIELATELQFRLKEPSPVSGKPGYIGLVTRNLAGPTPISDVADYLEGFARRL